jgi:hypothetical protein
MGNILFGVVVGVDSDIHENAAVEAKGLIV